METRIFRITICFIIWLIPIAGIYFTSKFIHNALGIFLTIICCFIFLPLSGALFDAITNDRVLCFNVNRPWESHLGNKYTSTDSSKGKTE